jgi:hypothetical protein
VVDRSQRLRIPFVLASLMLVFAVPAIAGTGPTAGFIESWTAVNDLRGWGGGFGTIEFSNPGTGGVLGSNDGYLIVSTLTNGGSLGTYSVGSEYVGDWVAAGIRSVKFWLNDVNVDEALEIHFSIGMEHSNMWQYNQGFDPPHGTWAQYVVDLTDSTKFTRIFSGLGSFEDALRGVTRVHFRHDLSFTPVPDPPHPDNVNADVGIDQFELSDASVPTAPLTWGRLKILFR